MNHTVPSGQQILHEILPDMKCAFQNMDRHDTILPDMSIQIHEHRIYPQILDLDLAKEPGVIRWTVHADNAPSRTGEIAIKDIPVEDKRKGDE